jgi:hypothetical protein
VNCFWRMKHCNERKRPAKGTHFLLDGRISYIDRTRDLIASTILAAHALDQVCRPSRPIDSGRTKSNQAENAGALRTKLLPMLSAN